MFGTDTRDVVAHINAHRWRWLLGLLLLLVRLFWMLLVRLLVLVSVSCSTHHNSTHTPTTSVVPHMGACGLRDLRRHSLFPRRIVPIRMYMGTCMSLVAAIRLSLVRTATEAVLLVTSWSFGPAKPYGLLLDAPRPFFAVPALGVPLQLLLLLG